MNIFRTIASILSCALVFFGVVTPLYAQVSSGTGAVTITAVVAETSSPSGGGTTGGGGGGGGGGGVALNSGTDTAIFKGLAYPGSIVTLLKNGTIVTELPASPNGTFEIHIQNLTQGAYSFGILAEDSERRKSSLDLYTVYVTSGITTVVSGIFIPPTITADKDIVKKGDIITLLGKAAPNASITLSIHSEKEIVKKTNSNDSGAWLYKLDSNELEMGSHEGKARTATENDLSLFSEALAFTVGTENRIRSGGVATTNSTLGARAKCDLNNDQRVNILDFSIMAYWYKRTGFPVKVDLNADSKINLTDFSILAYCWTG